MINRKTAQILSTLLLITVIGCAGTGGGMRPYENMIAQGSYDEALKQLLVYVTGHPDDARGHRLLGTVHYFLEDYSSATSSLDEAISLDPRNALARFYRGLVAERENDFDQAIFQYSNFIELGGKGDLQKKAQRRIEELKNQQAEQFARSAIANERDISPGEFSESTIGVVYFNGRFLSDALRPLTTGLADLIVSDFSKVSELQVVERLQLDRILNELQLSRSGAFDTSTAPRLGKLMGAAHVLGGGIAELPEEKLRIDPNLVDTKSGEVTLPEEAVGEFAQLIAMEKQIVFATIDQLGITLTQEQRDSIAAAPTESFVAFLMYSRGLEYLDQGKYEEAADEFNRALQEDPGFQNARDKSEITEVYLSVEPTGTVDQFQQYADRDIGTPGPPMGTATLLAETRDRLGFLPETRPGHDEPYTRPYGISGLSGTVIIRGTFDNGDN